MNKTYEGGNEHPFYFCVVSEVIVEIIGEEKDRNSPENWYQLEWTKLSEIQNIWLVPEKAKEEVLKRYLV